MARIVCLANSFKRNDRCIAGIDLETNRWVRPIGEGDEGAIGRERLVNGAEPELLDILDIPIGPLAIDHGCQPENRVLESGRWRKLGEMSKRDVLGLVENTDSCLLHNRDKKVCLSEFGTTIPQSKWKSLQLIRVPNTRFQENQWGKKECLFNYKGTHYTLKTTYPNVEKYLGKKGDFILTISMGGPYRRKQEDELCCWKMVAGVIELSSG